MFGLRLICLVHPGILSTPAGNSSPDKGQKKDALTLAENQ